jgi:hypothetical protein
MSTQGMKIRALLAQYEAEKLNALATLEVYLLNSTGIGEHPQILEEMDKLIDKLSTAEGKLETLKRYVVEDKPNTGNTGVTGAPAL